MADQTTHLKAVQISNIYIKYTHWQAIRFLSTKNNRNPFSVLLAVSCSPWYPLLRARHQVQAAAAVAAAMTMNLLHQQR